jgi:hypothetical protein
MIPQAYLFPKMNNVGVYYAGQNFKTDLPAFIVTRQVARQWIDEGGAWSINHGRDIALCPEKEDELKGWIDGRKLTADGTCPESLVMGERVMLGNAAGQRWAVKMTRAWNPVQALADHAESLKRYKQLRESGTLT